MKESVNNIINKRRNKESTILLTGGTSFLGSNIAIELINRGYSVIFLIRSNEELSASQRLHQIFQLNDFQEKQNIKVIDGRLSEENFDLSENTYNYLIENVDEIIHCASNTSFNDKKREQVLKVNVQGTLNLLKLAQEGKTYFFHYVSTAYSAGERQGDCPEEYITQDKFNNAYEMSKYRSEGNVLDICKRLGIRTNIYRPSIVYGNSKTGKSIRFNALYYVVRTIHYLKTIYERDIIENAGLLANTVGIKIMPDGKMHMPLRIQSNHDSFFNFIPVDYVVDAFLGLFDQSLEGDIFNIVNPKQTRHPDFLSMIENSLNISGLKSVQHESFKKEPRNPIEDLFYSYMDVYQPYFHDNRRFLCKKSNSILNKQNITCPDLENEIFLRCVNYALGVNWGKSLYDGIDSSIEDLVDWEIGAENEKLIAQFA